MNRLSRLETQVAALIAGVLLQTQVAALEATGLLHWWPDPVEGTDEVTGRRGIRRGFGALEAQPDVRLGYAAGWTELGPGITNQTFTLTFWMQSVDPLNGEFGAVLSQDSGLNDGWVLQQSMSGDHVEWVSGFFGGPSVTAVRWEITARRWHAVALQVTPTEVRLWINGLTQGKGPWTAAVSTHPGPLCVGNSVLGGHPWNGDLRDLRIFGRLLAEEEIRELARQPRSSPREGVSPTRLVPFTTVPLPTVKSGDYQLRRFTSDDGLPNAGIQCLTQGRDGALWLGFEGALARFDGRRFQMVDSGEPDFPLSPPDVCNLTEDSTGNLWLGLYHGLVLGAPGEWIVARVDPTGWSPIAVCSGGLVSIGSGHSCGNPKRWSKPSPPMPNAGSGPRSVPTDSG
ncbi:MAG TPA: hypothetical protein PLX89_12365 [Verrucomicrobiota bacterium]|nr:hypothetical protein [Verrucomicrobiota bacterium]